MLKSTSATADFPAFRPAEWLRGGHAQTLGAYLFPGTRYPYRAEQRVVPLEDGDAIVLHDDAPGGWKPGDPTALLIHGLAGCHQSGYMVRTAARLNAEGVRAFRMDMRGCGAGQTLSLGLMHSGRTGDVLAALAEIARHAPGSATTLIGFSLGGNLILNTVARVDPLPEQVRSAIAVCPPVELATCCRALGHGLGRYYDRFFARLLLKQYASRRKHLPHAPQVEIAQRPDSILAFDQTVTAPLTGFADADDYYVQTSSADWLARIPVPTRIVADEHDPMVPFDSIERHARSPQVDLVATAGGGHLGYVGRRGVDPDRRWLDWRLVEWTVAGW